MAFTPHHCPNQNCPQPTRGFVKKGTFTIKRTWQKIQRYQCKSCKQSLSSRTFARDYRQHKPHLNLVIYRSLSEGNSLRGVARILGVNYKTVYKKFLWLAAGAEISLKQNRNPQTLKTVYFDEQETIEHTKLKPLSIALAVEESYNILAAEVARIPSKGHLARISRAKYGPRPNESRRALNKMFELIKKQTDPCVAVNFVSDQKPSYSRFVKDHFPKSSHLRVKSKKAKEPHLNKNKKSWDPLFPVNQRCAKLRSDIKRLARRSWCTTKKVENLQYHLNLYICYNNKWTLV